MHPPPLSRALLPALTLVALLISGCAGYQLGAVKPRYMRNIETIAIPTAKNETLKPRIATNVTNHVIKAFQNDGTYQITTAGNADAVLELVISEIERRQARSARFNTLRSRELSVRMTVEYTLTNSNTGTRIIHSRSTQDTNIFLDANFQTSERQAIDSVARKVAADIVSYIAEGWQGEENLGDQIPSERRRILYDRLKESKLESEAFQR